MLGAPVAVTTTSEPGIRVKRPGFVAGPPPASLSLAPFDQLPKDILSGIAVAPGESALRAISLGLEVFLVKEISLAVGDPVDGIPVSAPTTILLMEVGGHGWAAIGFTVDDSQLGGHPLAPAIAGAKGAGELDRSVFAYALPMSAGEWVPAEDESVIASGPAPLLLAAGDAIHALDMHIALYETDLAKYAQYFTTRPLPPKPCVYFTLRPEFVQAHEAALEQAWGIADVNTATIFMTEPVGGTWATPTVYLTFPQLHLLGTAGLLPEIDGLAINAVVAGKIDAADEILLSLAAAPGGTGNPADQVLYTRHGGGPVLEPPRRVVVRRRPTGYGSLGGQMRAGLGLGDFCTADPFGSVDQPWGTPLLDDFYIARRLAASTIPAPGPALSIGAHRHRDGETIFMRSFMSWPDALEKSGKATVRSGRMLDLKLGVDEPGNLVWDQSQVLTYHGEPLVFDRKLPTNGLLRAGPPPAEPPPHVPACIVQWFLEAGGKQYRSPIAALRY